MNLDHSACVLSIGTTLEAGHLFVQVVAHIAAAPVPHSVSQYLKAGQITPLAKPTGGHRLVLMMSFLRRLALKSVAAAKKESVAKCAGPLQYGVGRPDGANTIIKTIQYQAEADSSRVLVALDPKAAVKNVSRRAMMPTTIIPMLRLGLPKPPGHGYLHNADSDHALGASVEPRPSTQEP